MRIFKRLFGKKEVTSQDLDSMLRGIVTGRSTSGIAVNSNTAMENTTFFASVRTLSEAISQLPWILYEKQGDNGRERAEKHPLYDILKDSPNSFQTSFEFRQDLLIHALTHGHAFIFINRSSSGKVLELNLLEPEHVKIEKDDFSLSYRYQPGTSKEQVFQSDEIMRISGFPGVLGEGKPNMISFLRESIGLAKAAEIKGAAFFGNGARPGGILSHPGNLTKEAKENIATSWNAAYTGRNAHKTAVLDEGIDYKPIGHTAEESQYTETRKLQRSEIAGALGVPPHKIGDLERATFTNIEHQSLEFVINSVLPWCRRIEQAVSKYLLTPAERKRYYSEILVDGLIRGDIETRYKAYQVAITHGILSPNEVRARENLNPRSDGFGDDYFYPSNMIPAGQEPETEESPIEEEESSKKLKLFKGELRNAG